MLFDCTDQLGNSLSFSARPLRVVSLVPSQSELLCDLGLQHALVGITKFCIHPAQLFNSVERVGGTKDLDLEKIRRLRPDLIIGNKEENDRAQIEALQQEFKVWMSDIYDFNDAFGMMKSLGEIFGKEQAAALLIGDLSASLARIKDLFLKKRVAYFIWNAPYMLAAGNTFIDHVIAHLGFDNAAAQWQRYPQVNEAALRELGPELCFLSSEPFPFKEKHVRELQQILPGSKIIIVDGELFSWYGSRLRHLEAYVHELSTRIS